MNNSRNFNMKAPDKIFAGTVTEGIGISKAWRCYPEHLENPIEYVRKDALLERLEKVAAEYKKRSDEGELVWQNMCGVKEAISILNEM